MAALAALLFVAAPLPQAATTTLLLQVSNATGHGLKIQAGGSWFNSTQIIPNGGQHPFNIQLSARFMTERRYPVSAEIYNSETNQLMGAGEILLGRLPRGPQLPGRRPAGAPAGCS